MEPDSSFFRPIPPLLKTGVLSVYAKKKNIKFFFLGFTIDLFYNSPLSSKSWDQPVGKPTRYLFIFLLRMHDHIIFWVTQHFKCFQVPTYLSLQGCMAMSSKRTLNPLSKNKIKKSSLILLEYNFPKQRDAAGYLGKLENFPEVFPNDRMSHINNNYSNFNLVFYIITGVF